MALIAVLVRGSGNRDRLHAVLHERVDVLFCDTGGELLRAAAVKRPDAVIVGLHGERGRSHVPTISALRAQSPDIPIFALCELGHEDAQELFQAASAGINQLLLYAIDDAWIALGKIPGATERESIALRVVCVADIAVPTVAKRVFRQTLQNICPRPTVAQIASSIGITRQALARRFACAGLLSPGKLISWSRLLFAAAALEGRVRSIEEAALLSGFDSVDALRRMLHDYTGLHPKRLRENAGLHTLVNQFRAALSNGVVCPRRDPPPSPDGSKSTSVARKPGASGKQDVA